MAWEPPEGISLENAFYAIMPKITNSSWNRFVRCGLRLDQADIDEILMNHRGDRKEQKYRMCEKWRENVGASASVEYLYATLNYFLFPDDCPTPVPTGKGKGESTGTKMKATGPHKTVSSKSLPVTTTSDAKGFQDRSQNVTVVTTPSEPEDLAQYCSNIKEVDIVPSMREFVNSTKSMSSVYKRTEKGGNVIIINNTFRHNQRYYRAGSEVDVENMEKLWKHFGCKVSVWWDLHAEDITKALKNFSDDSDKYDYCTIMIMSHGSCDRDGKDVIYGNDMKQIYTKDILEMFNNKESSHLQEIPKIFFFQSCRGITKDKGVAAHAPTAPQKAFVDTRVIAPGCKEEARDTSDAGPTDKLPRSSDMLIAYATQPGDQAFRNTTEGSWFINAIANVFMKRAKDEHILDLMVEVNSAVAAKSASQDGAKAMSHIEFNLRKKLYLFPGFNSE